MTVIKSFLVALQGVFIQYIFLLAEHHDAIAFGKLK